MEHSRSVTVRLPFSKSISNRLLLLNALSGGSIRIVGLSDSSDTTTLGTLLTSNDYRLDAGDGGTTFRFLLPFLALQARERVLTGSARMQERPVGELVDALRSIGAIITYEGTFGYPPVKIGPGSVRGGTISVDTSRSSQFVTAMLLLAPFLPGGLSLKMTGGQVSASYVLMTLRVFDLLGIRYQLKDDVIDIPQQQVKSTAVEVERDWSSAAFWYELAAIRPDMTLILDGLSLNSIQGDEVVVSLFSRLGVVTNTTEKGLLVACRDFRIPSDPLEFDLTATPDIAPALVVACFARRCPAVFFGIDHLQYKESDRMAVLERLLTSCGAGISYTGDRFELTSFPERPYTLQVDPHDDHRIAMAFAVLGVANQGVTVLNPHVVRKSYPDFWKQLAQCGFSPSASGAGA